MNVCEKCGERGKLEDLVCCLRCGNSFQHWYCFDVFVGRSPQVKRVWRCEDYAPKKTNSNPTPYRKSKRITRAAEDKLNWMNHLIERGVVSIKAKLHVDRSLEAKQPLNEKAKKLSSCDQSTKNQEPRKLRKLILDDEAENDPVRDQASQLAATAIHDSPISSCAWQHIEAHVVDHSRPCVDPIWRSPGIKQPPNEKVKMALSSYDLSPENQRSEKAERKFIFQDRAEREPVKSQGDELDPAIIENPPVFSAFPSVESYARPIKDPIWRGHFCISNAKKPAYVRLVAHLSCKAYERVHVACTALPQYLGIEIFPRTEVWPQSFRRSALNGEGIALYFFPEFESVVDYKALVHDMNERGLAMKTWIKNAEFLVFSSRELPSEHQRFLGNFYLWGVFKNPDPSSPNQRYILRDPRRFPQLARMANQHEAHEPSEKKMNSID